MRRTTGRRPLLFHVRHIVPLHARLPYQIRRLLLFCALHGISKPTLLPLEHREQSSNPFWRHRTQRPKTTPMVIYTGSEPNLIDKRFVPRDLLRSIRPPPVHTLTSSTSHPIRVSLILLLHVRLGYLRVRVWFRVDPNLVTRVLLGTNFIII